MIFVYFDEISKYKSLLNRAIMFPGFGHDLAHRLDELGFTVFAGCLHPGGHGAKKLKSSSSEKLHIVNHDVSSDDSVAKAHQYVVDHLPESG